MSYAASSPKYFMKILEDVEPDAMLQLERNSGAGEEPTDYMSESWDVWHDNCTAAIENGLRNKPEFLAIVGGLPIQTIMCILDAFDSSAFASSNFETRRQKAIYEGVYKWNSKVTDMLSGMRIDTK
jgi:hypothetical protein